MNNAGGSIMLLYEAFVALEIAEERRREADQDRLAALARAGRTENDRSIPSVDRGGARFRELRCRIARSPPR